MNKQLLLQDHINYIYPYILWLQYLYPMASRVRAQDVMADEALEAKLWAVQTRR
jgi:hypothetical protein